jgi:putative membrane protein
LGSWTGEETVDDVNKAPVDHIFCFPTASIAQESIPAQQLTPPVTQSRLAPTLEPAGFANQAASGNAFGMLSSKLALRRSQTPEIKEFAQTILNDHQRAQDELRHAAKSETVILSEELSNEQKQTLLALEQAPENQFDAAYLSAQMKSHGHAIQLLGPYSADGPGGGLKAYARAHFPALRIHMVRAQSLTNP